MKTSLIKKQAGLAAACALALGVVSGTAFAQVMPYSNAADHTLLKDSRGQNVVSQFGLCWHTGQGPVQESSPQCDPNYVAPAAPLAAAPAPAPAPYVAPRAAPVVVAAAPQPVYEKVKLDADALFDFDKAVLRPAGRDTLDSFINRIQGIDPSTIMAVGHTDRIGSNAYNQNLSERRVAAVKDYLVSKGVASGQVHTSAMGETQPETKAGDCNGAKSAKVIACLQPDRRVELEVSGSRIKR